MRIVRAELKHLHVLAPLFDEYRRFMGHQSDPQKGIAYLRDRLARNESIAFMAFLPKQQKSSGFIQMYPSFSSLSLKKHWVVNDLYVLSEYRNNDVGTTLIKAAEDHARATMSGGLLLEIDTDNEPAQRFFEKQGFSRDSGLYDYYLNF